MAAASRAALLTVKVLFRTQNPELPAAQLSTIESKIDGLADALAVLTRNRWRDLAFGILATVVDDHLASTEVTSALFHLLSQALSQLSGGTIPALPF